MPQGWILNQYRCTIITLCTSSRVNKKYYKAKIFAITSAIYVLIESFVTKPLTVKPEIPLFSAARVFSRTASKGRMTLNFCGKRAASTEQRKVSRNKKPTAFLKLETDQGQRKFQFSSNCIGESLSLFTFFLISIPLNAQKPWPYI